MPTVGVQVTRMMRWARYTITGLMGKCRALPVGEGTDATQLYPLSPCSQTLGVANSKEPACLDFT